MPHATPRSWAETAGRGVRLGYRPDIDGLRAIAVASVVAYHAGLPFVPGGFTGVDIFFVISGFLLTAILLEDVDRTGRVQILAFYARRVRRILPTLFLVVLATEIAVACLLSPALQEPQRISRSALSALLMLANIHFLRAGEDYFSAPSDFDPFLHTWSLSVEEQFYLVWPALFGIAAVLLARVRSRDLWLGLSLGLLCLTSWACAMLLAHWRSPWAFYLTPARGWELGAGGLLAIGLPSVRRLPRKTGAAMSSAGLALLAAGILFVPSDQSSPLTLALFPVLGALLVIAGNAVHPGSLTGRLLSQPAMVRVGLASYAWYLWHWPALSISRILTLGQPHLPRDVLISLGTLGLAFVTLRWFERPLRYFRSGDRAFPSLSVCFAGGGATVLTVCLVLGVSHWVQHRPLTAAEAEVLRASEDAVPGCLAFIGSREITAPSDCLARADGPKIILWGDSIADRWAPAVKAWPGFASRRVAFEQLTKSACPPVMTLLPTEPLAGDWKPYEGCRTFNEWDLSRFPRTNPSGQSGVVIAANWWLRATDLDLRRLGRPEARQSFDVNAVTTDESLAALEAGMRATLRDITGRGLRVLLILQSPMLIRADENALIDAPVCLFRSTDQDCVMPRGLHERLSEPANRVLIKVASEFPEVRVFDPTPLFCPNDTCPARIGDIVGYTDHVHFSRTMADAMSGVLAGYLDWLSAPDGKNPGKHEDRLAGTVGVPADTTVAR
jgi:peptidoglycan/LPS O-acetylase OafA/YrhL